MQWSVVKSQDVGRSRRLQVGLDKLCQHNFENNRYSQEYENNAGIIGKAFCVQSNLRENLQHTWRQLRIYHRILTYVSGGRDMMAKYQVGQKHVNSSCSFSHPLLLWSVHFRFWRTRFPNNKNSLAHASVQQKELMFVSQFVCLFDCFFCV